MDKQRLFDAIEQKKEEFCKLLAQICDIESNSADFEGVRAVERTLSDFAAARGFTVRREEYENAGACAIIEMNESAALPALMFSGHMDTVYQKGAFGYPPTRREDDLLFGPGTADCKGGIITALLAMDALKSCGFCERPLRLFLQCDEEVGSRYSGRRSIDFMIREAKRCAAFLNCENARPGKLTTRRKGILKMVVAVSGKAAHAKDYKKGASAVAEAAYKIIRFHEQSLQGPLCYNCTLSPLAMPSNAVPDKCEIVLDIRVSSMEEAETAAAFVRKAAAECRVPLTSGEVVRQGMRPPMEPCAQNTALFEKINRICVQNGLPQYEAFMSAGGADASNVSAAGVPCVDSMGVEGENYHTLNEYCNLASLVPRAKVLALVAAEFDQG